MVSLRCAFRAAALVGAAALWGSAQATQCGQVQSATGGGVQWYGPDVVVEGMNCNPGLNGAKPYILVNIPTYLLGGQTVTSGAWPGLGLTSFTWDITFTAPVRLFIWTNFKNNGGLDTVLPSTGWVTWSSSGLERQNGGGGLAQTVGVYTKYFASGTGISITGLSGTMVAGVVSSTACTASFAGAATSTATLTTTSTTGSTTTTMTSTTILTTVTASSTTSSTTATTSSATMTTSVTTATITSTTVTTTTVTTTTATVTTATVTTATTTTSTSLTSTTNTTTTTFHFITTYTGALYLNVSNPCGVVTVYNQDPAALQPTLKNGVAGALAYVDSAMVDIISVSCKARRLQAAASTYSSLPGMFHVNYQIRMPSRVEQQLGVNAADLIVPADPSSAAFATSFATAFQSSQVLLTAGINTAVYHVYADLPVSTIIVSDPYRTTSTDTTTTTTSTTTTTTTKTVPPSVPPAEVTKKASTAWIAIVLIALVVLILVVAVIASCSKKGKESELPIKEEELEREDSLPDRGVHVCI